MRSQREVVVRGTYPRRGDARRDRYPYEYLWSPREDELLRRRWRAAAGVDVVGELAARLGRSRKAIRMRALALGLPRRGRRRPPPLTPEIRRDALYSTDPLKEIAARTGRTVKSIKMIRWRHRRAQP